MSLDTDFESLSWLRLLAARDLRGAISRICIIESVFFLLKLAQETVFYGNVITPWPVLLVEVVFISFPIVALALWLFAYIDKQQIKLLGIATRDVLTGLPNRTSFYENASRLLEKPGGVIMMIDVDHFKTINDTYGHAVGDYCLKSIADYLAASLRNVDLIARIGGEEFAVMLVDTSETDAHIIGNRLAAGFELSLPDLGIEHHVSVSIGAVHSRLAHSIEDCLIYADHALYTAKENGRAQIVMADGLSQSRAIA